MKSEDFYSILCNEEEETLKKLDSIRQLKEFYSKSNGISTDAPLPISKNSKSAFPTEYNPELTWGQKTIVALFRIKKGDTTKLATSLLTLEPLLSKEKAKSVVTDNAWRLSKEGVIGKRKRKNKNIYFIKEEGQYSAV